MEPVARLLDTWAGRQPSSLPDDNTMASLPLSGSGSASPVSIAALLAESDVPNSLALPPLRQKPAAVSKAAVSLTTKQPPAYYGAWDDQPTPGTLMSTILSPPPSLSQVVSSKSATPSLVSILNATPSLERAMLQGEQPSEEEDEEEEDDEDAVEA